MKIHLALTAPEAMLANVRIQLQTLNNMVFTDGEWARYVEGYLDRPSDNLVEKQGKYTTIIFTILFLTMGISKTSTCRNRFWYSIDAQLT